MKTLTESLFKVTIALLRHFPHHYVVIIPPNSARQDLPGHLDGKRLGHPEPGKGFAERQ
jgi:hypothetical protein